MNTKNKQNISDKKNDFLKKLSKYTSYDKTWIGLKNRKIKTRVLSEDNLLESKYPLLDNELPILEYFKDNLDYLILTTESIHYMKNRIFKSFKYSDILSIDDRNNNFITLKEAPKFIDLKLNLANDDIVDLIVETGSPMQAIILIIIWNKQNI